MKLKTKSIWQRIKDKIYKTENVFQLEFDTVRVTKQADNWIRISLRKDNEEIHYWVANLNEGESFNLAKINGTTEVTVSLTIS